MIRTLRVLSALLVGLALLPAAAAARGFGVEVWTNRGNDAVYRPGEEIQIKARTSDDAYLLVYEIDAEGYVRVLYPLEGRSGFVEGRRNYRVPPEAAGYDLVVNGPVGEGYIVAVASVEPFEDLPWYLRPYNPQAEEVGYLGVEDEEEGITAEGRVVGDPFVAMERIRRRIVGRWDDEDGFATSYTSYYVHQQVRYPRYLCYDCHRPSRWAWWDGFDPYYTSCSVFDFRVNWSWGWGPSYWYGCVPYYIYMPRHGHHFDYPWYSSWDGWRSWNHLWGGSLVRYKSPPPQGYRPPSKYDNDTRWRDRAKAPPGIIVTDVPRGRQGMRPGLPVGGNRRDRPEATGPRTRGDQATKPGVTRQPVERGRGDGTEDRFYRPQRGERPTPKYEPPRGRDETPRGEGRREERPQVEPPRGRQETPRGEGRREERPNYTPPKGGQDPPRGEGRREERQRLQLQSRQVDRGAMRQERSTQRSERPWTRPTVRSEPRRQGYLREAPAPRREQVRAERPSPRYEQPRVQRYEQQPRAQRREQAREAPRMSRPEPRHEPAREAPRASRPEPRHESPRGESRGTGGGHGGGKSRAR